jgi:RIO kinase 1
MFSDDADMYSDDDRYDELAAAFMSEPEQPKRARRRRRREQDPPAKTSYESNPEVQHWLQSQARERSESKPPFAPTFLVGQRDRLWTLSSLTHFYEQDLISDVLGVVKSGKEATVYCCAAEPATGMRYLAAKIYRPRMFRSLRNDAVYRLNRPQRDEAGRPVRGVGQQRGAIKKTERWRADQVTSWIAYEFETQRLLFDAGADVPRPISQVGNAMLMEYIGAQDSPAPLLREVTLAREEASPLFDQLLRNVEIFLAYDRIHGDLSSYNILYWEGRATVIDFAQAVAPRQNPDVYALLERDVDRLCHYFARYGAVGDARAIASELWRRYIGEEMGGTSKGVHV